MKLAVVCCALVAMAAAQDTATVDGVVVNKVTGAGIGGATVRFMATRAARYEAQTDAAGAFRITGVKPGDYNSIVEKSGYFPPDPPSLLVFPGERAQHHVEPGGPLHLRLELNPPARIEGRVTRADGNPAQASVDLGRGRTANTNAEGAFVFDNLQPGPYTLLARPKTSGATNATGGSRTETVPTYYPSVVDSSQAESIVVAAGADLSGYEIRLRSVPVYRVRGLVLTPDGKPAAKAVVELQAHVAGEGPDRPFLGMGSGRQSFSSRTGKAGLPETEEPFVTGNDGMFEFPSVPAGEWRLRAEGDPVWDEVRHQSVSSIGSATFNLGRGDPDDIKIQTAMPFRLSGAVVLSDGSAPAKDVIVAVSLYSETGPSGSGGVVDGALRLDVISGAQEIHANVMLGNYYADSIWLGAIDVTSQKVELTPASPPVKIVLKPTAAIRGAIEDGASGAVVLFPQNLTGIGYSTQSEAGGAFDLPGVPPGAYYAIALDRFDSRIMADAVLLRSLMPRASSVRLESGSAATVQLRLNRAPE
jgi:hypothetical protein